MRQETIEIYKLEELSDSVQEKVYSDWLQGFEYFWSGDNQNSLEGFLKIFHVSIKNWNVSSCDYNFQFLSHYQEDIENLSGIRLLKWLWNNHKNDIYKPKYLSKNGVGSKNYISGYSKIQIESSCTITGYCMDNSLLFPILKFMSKPDKNTNLYDLLYDCIDSFFSDYKADMEYQESFEAFKDDCLSNEMEFTIKGEQYY